MISASNLQIPVNRRLRGAVSLLGGYWMWAAVTVSSAVVFFSMPGGYNETAHSILHGLCAQTPSHTLMFGDVMLPFDSRMTGIYGGFLITVATIAARGRLFWYGNPPLRVTILLVVLIALMGVDGFNSLLGDLGWWHPYPAHNALRIVTGYGAGISLAVVLCWLVASSVWRMSAPRSAIASTRDLTMPAIGLGGFGVALTVRPEWLHFPVSMLLVVSAWITVTMLVLVIVLLICKLDTRIVALRQLHVLAATAAVFAIAVMMALAGGRFWLERTFGITNAMM